MICVFCHKEISFNASDDTICTSPANNFPTDTVGNHHHAWIPQDNREKGKLAVARIKALRATLPDALRSQGESK